MQSPVSFSTPISRPSIRKKSRTQRKRHLLALQILSLFAVPAVCTSVEAASPNQFQSPRATTLAQQVRTTIPIAAPRNSAPVADDFLGAANADTTSPPTVQEDANALFDQSVAPAPVAMPNVGGMNPPPANLATGFAASSLGATAAGPSASPAMMGDFFGGSFLFSSMFAVGAALAGGDRRFKIAENVSPMPQDRVYFNYNHFENALTDANGDTHSLDRFAFGMERRFADDLCSLEVRLPFASALNSTYDFSNPIPQNTELGNLGINLKALLATGDDWLVSGGATLTLPTGDDYRQRFAGSDVFVIENEAVHLAPYLGFLATPNRDWFFQGFMQFDFDLRGNDVIAGGVRQGRLQDQNLMFVDLSAGRWLARRSMGRGQTAGIAAISELHYTMTMNDADGVAGITNPFGHVDVLNATLGMHIQYGLAALRVGAAAPLRDNEEKLFDAEVFVQVSRAL